MKQKMRIKVFVNSEKCMKKAMKVAVVAKVAMEGVSKDEIVVVGDGVDATYLVNAVRKKVCHATLESLEEVKPSSGNQKKPPVEEKSTTPHCCIAQCPSFSYQQPLPEKYVVVHDSYAPTTGCLIM